MKCCSILLYLFTFCQLRWLGLSEETNFWLQHPQSLSHLTFWIYSVGSKSFLNHDVNIKVVSCVKSQKFNACVLALICILVLGQSLNLENFQLCLLVVYLNKLTFLSQSYHFFQEVGSSLEVQRVKEDFLTILDVTFMYFSVI